MQLSTLQDQIRQLTNTTSGNYSDADINANLTRHVHSFVAEIADAMDDWDFQGDIATANLVADQREYTFPTDLLKIKKIQLYLDSDWVEASFFDINESAIPISSEADITDNFSNSKPYIEILEKSIFIYSGAIVAVTGGIKIWYTKETVGKDSNGADITSFSGATDTPNISEAFQRGLIYAACVDYYIKSTMHSDADRMEARVEKVISRMRSFYSKKVQDRKIILKSALDISDYE